MVTEPQSEKYDGRFRHLEQEVSRDPRRVSSSGHIVASLRLQRGQNLGVLPPTLGSKTQTTVKGRMEILLG